MTSPAWDKIQAGWFPGEYNTGGSVLGHLGSLPNLNLEHARKTPLNFTCFCNVHLDAAKKDEVNVNNLECFFFLF